ncbi:ABC transporter ATP-binding protein [Candidatus Saccharibacteria bacterium]|nr:ABC transporter ATP-binding protein [Candidatus Saccharibacteria bacterium]
MFRLFKNLTRHDFCFIILILLAIVAQVWLELKMPDYMSEITILVQSEGSEMADILRNGGFMLLCALGAFLANAVSGYFISVVAASFSMHTRKVLFDKVEDLSINEVKGFSTSSLITRTTNDITQIQMLLSMGMRMIVRAPLTAGWAIFKIANKSWQWSSITAVAVVLILAVNAVIMALVTPRFKVIQKLTDKLNGVARENLKGIRVVRAFNAEKYQERKFEKTNSKLTNTQIFVQNVFSVMGPSMYLVMYGVTLAIYFAGAYIIDGAAMQDKLTIFGDMVVFSTYAMHVIMSFLVLTMIFMMLPRAQVSAKRVNDVLDAEISVKDGTRTEGEANMHGVVEFRKVSFRYPGAEDYLLKDISFTAQRGETVAFIGSTGSGKSTLINLVPRFYDATDGAVLVDGVDVREYKLQALNNKISYVPQKAVLFDGTVKSNVTYGDNGRGKIHEKKVHEAIRVAQAKKFVEKMPDDYDSHIAQGGTNISGGQKQRLAIARAIARDPEIYIFDDSFSALDYKTDATLRTELKKYTKDATSLIVAQRIGTIMHADKILVLDKGVCVGMGTHKELMKNCEIYKQIALSQLTKEELNA